jgi:hypothetical protein
MKDKYFRFEVEQLAQNVILVAGVAGSAGARRILEFSYEAAFTFKNPTGRQARVLQYLGWRAWPLAVAVGARGGSQHLEVATPAGLKSSKLRLNRGIEPQQLSRLRFLEVHPM